MEIVCCTDNNFIMPCGIMLKSVCENNKCVCVHVIIDDSVSEKNKASLRSIVNSYTDNSICFYLIDGTFFNNFPSLGKILPRITRATYYRLFLAEILPSTIDKVLFLDCDIIVRHDLSELWSLDIDEFAVGCIVEHEIDNIQVYNRLEYSQDIGYFNAGVLLVNLKYWRDHSLNKEYMGFINNHPERIKYHDQDVLNGVLYDKKYPLPLQYNVQAGFFYKKEYVMMNLQKYGEEIYCARQDPMIVHFSTGLKPWFEDCPHPMKQEFIKYKSMTEWRNTPLLKQYIPNRPLKVIIGDILRIIRIKKPIEYRNSNSKLYDHEIL